MKLVDDTVLFSWIESFVVSPIINHSSEIVGHVERLEEGVHVASGAFIGNSQKPSSGFLFFLLLWRFAYLVLGVKWLRFHYLGFYFGRGLRC